MGGSIVKYRVAQDTGRDVRDPGMIPAAVAGREYRSGGYFSDCPFLVWTLAGAGIGGVAGVEPNVRQFPLADRHDCRVPFGFKRSARPDEGAGGGRGGQNLARSPTEVTRPSGFDTKPLYPNAPPMMPAVLPL